ncbi:single-stranded DNA-binding protein [Trichococcus collinsii]|uniref:Single-stranded DNA-binding protein n=1 Tax=Trichococcus collinsii TaxID=157076 RepID=A0AB37ZXD8_9LACT|nr:single-stranded DNA-binding protein [Trichococcus collinsii]CZR02496.1 Hypothetical protein Tcol_2050 [Trichococcus collinsii]SDZ95458.1 single-strand DNA-binding protein [Trichococcus collinsii]
MSINTVVLVGRLTKDVDLRYTSTGTAVGTFSLAVNRQFTNQAGEREADFINCVIWRKSAENFANFTRKGALVGITGRIQTRNYEGNDGKRVYVTEIVADNFTLLEPKQTTEQRPRESTRERQQEQKRSAYNDFNNTPDPFGSHGEEINIDDDSLPF